MSEQFLEILADRRDGRAHSFADFRVIANGAASGEIPDYQLSAWLMAAYLNPLDLPQTVWLTKAMAESGERVDLSGLPKPWVDKHSTGGVGDKTSLVLLPMLASAGLTVVKMSGRGLGITGGTVDKLGSIPGFRLALSISELREQAARIGCALTGQTPSLAPADKVLYGLRDATATVASIPLIVSSILSKKIAGGAQILVLDVKCGSGAFMKSVEDATSLAKALSDVCGQVGLKLSVSITDMDQPLGEAIGNALEVREALRVLREPASALSSPTLRFRELCLRLAAETLHAAGVAGSLDEGASNATAVLESGAAAAKAEQWVAAQGGPEGIANVLKALPTAPIQQEFVSEQAGWIERFDAGIVGEAVLELGAGRHRKEDSIDPSVGVEIGCVVGDRLERGQGLFRVHARSAAQANLAAAAVREAVVVGDSPVAPRPLFLPSAPGPLTSGG